METVANAIITGTFLGVDSHYILYARISLTGKDIDGHFVSPIGKGLECWIKNVLYASGVESWEQLKGRVVRCRYSKGDITSISHLIEDRWFFQSDPISAGNDDEPELSQDSHLIFLKEHGSNLMAVPLNCFICPPPTNLTHDSLKKVLIQFGDGKEQFLSKAGPYPYYIHSASIKHLAKCVEGIQG